MVDSYATYNFNKPVTPLNNAHQDGFPPSWMIEEALTFGKWSVTYSMLRRGDKKQISKKFNLSPFYLESWLHSLVYLRNLCVHHGRIWNRVFRVPPKILKEHNDKVQENNKLYYYIVAMGGLLKFIEPANRLYTDINILLEQHPFIDKTKMGFFDNWEAYISWEDNEHKKSIKAA